ncbi:hypothetical protein FRC01_003241 [Tulasnella sp. 417]|nr:hypothetical protein FRC01_003241 [Tulasnella sp. 417]
MADTADSSAPCHADLRHLHERIQTIGEVSMTLDKTMRTKCTTLRETMVWTLGELELNLALMSRKKLVKVIVEFTTVLNAVEEDFRRWVKYNRAMTLFKANDMSRSVGHHASRFDNVLDVIEEPNATEDDELDPNPDSLYNQGILKALEKGLEHFEKLQKVELNTTPLLEPSANIFDNPTDPGVQIMTLRLSPDFEITPPTEIESEIETISYLPYPMFSSRDSSVYKMLWAKRCYVAAKTCKENRWGVDEEIWIPRMKRNADVWRSMNHRNILPLLGICRFVNSADPRVYFITPWMKNGNVKQYLILNPGADRIQLIHDVALGLQYLHEIGVVHRNLKASNVLVNLDGTALISGFSGSKILGPDNKRSVYCNFCPQNRRWAPPGGGAYWGTEEDIWSWSMTAVEILSGDRPFKKIQNLDIEAAATIWSGGLRPSPEDYLPRQIATPEVWDLLNKCWKCKPEERIKIDEVVADLEAERRRNGWDPTTAPTSGRRRDWEWPTSF